MAGTLSRFGLEGRTAIVTGVGPGIGAHAAMAFAEVGANVVCAARSADFVEQVAKDIEAAGGRALAVPTDVGDKAALERLVAATHDAFGPVHVVLNNAATGDVAVDHEPWSVPDEVWQRAMDVNLMAPYRLTGLVAKDMQEHGKGSIITVLTCGAFTPIPPQFAYGATKAGLHMLTRYLAKACAPWARVNALCPGSMNPDPIHDSPAAAAFAPHVAKNAIQRPGYADETVGALLLLASDASSYTTGSVIFTEGGRVGTIS
jgi:NAD(P)-dependent dehydrogenase (short-subunit alcohol dehydrogenase family)